jgi:predicted metal-dependent enzyme (double-stranded beta helix superfamily)
MNAAALAVRADLRPLRGFVADLSRLLDDEPDEARILAEGADLLRDLIATDDWLPDDHAAPDPEYYRQYLLYRDPRERFSVVSFVWGPGQRTPIHDHTIWGLVGVLRGAEIVENYDRHGGLRLTGSDRLEAGDVEALSPVKGDIHRVSNGAGNAVSVSIHVYGADIGAVERHVFALDGAIKPFVSGYAPAPSLDLETF